MPKRNPIDVPESVLRKAHALGREGRRWLDDLTVTIAGLEEEWDIRVGGTIEGGTSAYVARATTGDGQAVVLKMAIPEGLPGQGTFERELSTVEHGQGRGFVRLLRSDGGRRFMLMEELGRPLATAGLPIEHQLTVLAGLVASAWQPLGDATGWRTGADQAQWLHDFVGSTWEVLGRPCPERVIGLARERARARRDAFDPDRAVLIHGDAHPWNALEGRSVGAYKLIDPDGMVSEPAHDLAIPLRQWNDEVLAGDGPAVVDGWCEHLRAQTGVAADAIWDWAFVERVSTGLFLLQLGDGDGHRFLGAADMLAAQRG